MPRAAARSSVQDGGRPVAGGAEQDPLLAVAHEPGLHEQLDVAVGIGAGHVEACRPALGTLAKHLLHHSIADVAGVAHADRIELHDRPLVADGLAFHPDQAGDVALLVVDVHQVVGPEGPQWQPEQAEDPDRRTVDRQTERSRVGGVGLAQAGQLAEGGEVREPRWADLARAALGADHAHRAGLVRRVGCGRRPEPSPGSSCSAAMVATRRWKRVSPASSGWKAVATMLR